MEQVFNEPIISHFFQSIKENDKLTTLKQLILLGINVISSKIHGYQCCFCRCRYNGYLRDNIEQKTNPVCNAHGTRDILGEVKATGVNSNIVSEIQKINKKIDLLADNLNRQTGNHNIRSSSQPKQEIRSANEQKNQIQNQNRSQFRHHLDDSEVKSALRNPYALEEPRKKEKKQSLEKNYQVQKQIDEEQLRKNKNKPVEVEHQISQQQYTSNKLSDRNLKQGNIKAKTLQKGQQTKSKKSMLGTLLEGQSSNQHGKRNSLSQLHRGRNKTTPLYPGNVRSKIKSLIQRDKQKSRTNAFLKKSKGGQGIYCQFEYSDEEAFAEQTKQILKMQQKQANKNCPVHTQLNRDEQFKWDIHNGQQSQPFEEQGEDSRNNCSKEGSQQGREQRNENSNGDNVEQQQQELHAEETVSQSSSFSKFSMNSKREAGKISGIKK